MLNQQGELIGIAAGGNESAMTQLKDSLGQLPAQQKKLTALPMNVVYEKTLANVVQVFGVD